MAGTIRLFEKTPAGLLVEVAPDQAEATRAGRLLSRVNLEIDVLWTAEEAAERLAEERAAAAARDMKLIEDEAARERKAAALAKLEALGISADELKDAIG
jgi:hypothetical protein